MNHIYSYSVQFKKEKEKDNYSKVAYFDYTYNTWDITLDLISQILMKI